MAVESASPFRKIGELHEHKKIVRGDVIRRHYVWRQKGIENREILHGTLDAVFNSMYAHDEHPRTWLSFLTYIEEQVKFHRNKIMDTLPGVPE